MSAVEPIESLIAKRDNVEIVRDRIGDILKINESYQRSLAPNPDDYGLRVFTERSNPWGEFQNDPPPGRDRWPIVNVTFDRSTFIESASSVVDKQKADAVYYIDCYGYGIGSQVNGGHNPADRMASLEAQRAMRLCRNILMSANYVYLGLRGIVTKRWPQSVTMFQPSQEGRAVQSIVAARLELRVEFEERSPQFEGEPFEGISIGVKRAETGELYLIAEYDYSEV